MSKMVQTDVRYEWEMSEIEQEKRKAEIRRSDAEAAGNENESGAACSGPRRFEQQQLQDHSLEVVAT